MTGIYGAGLTDEEYFKVLDRAHGLGCTFWVRGHWKDLGNFMSEGAHGRVGCDPGYGYRLRTLRE
jgi:hypothetical protein